MKIEVYADGSATTADTPGGWAFVVVIDGQKVHEGSGGILKATNNVAELTAALSGLEYCATTYPTESVTLISDSQLALNYTNGSWNCRKLHLAMLHAKLRKIYESGKVTTQWVRGHSGVEHNERCDQLAKSEREKLVLANER